MCHYIYVFLPATTDLKAASALFEKYARAFRQVDYLPAHKQNTSDLQILTTRSFCDCGTALGCQAESRKAPVKDLTRDIEARRKLGWSEAKIARWKADKEKAAQPAERIFRGQDEEIKRWLDLISDVLQTGTADRFGLLLYWGHDSLTEGAVAALRRVTVPFSSLSADQLLHIDEDVIYSYQR